MRRRTLDKILSAVGLVLTVMLLVAGALATWGWQFAHDNVRSQLTRQNIHIPPAGSPALASPEIGPYLNEYAGQQLTTGDQAKAYADHYIAVHLDQVAGGKTYAELSEQARANPDDAALQGQVQTMFRGETLRGLLLNAYAFWQLGEIARIAAFACFAGAAVMLLLTLLGIAHLRRVDPETTVFAERHEHAHA